VQYDTVLWIRIAFNINPDPAFFVYAVPDPSFFVHAVPDPDPHPVPGFDDRKLKKISNIFSFFFKNCENTYPWISKESNLKEKSSSSTSKFEISSLLWVILPSLTSRPK
jgi:hypothetical protein